VRLDAATIVLRLREIADDRELDVEVSHAARVAADRIVLLETTLARYRKSVAGASRSAREFSIMLDRVSRNLESQEEPKG
jgi:hypothetical protein